MCFRPASVGADAKCPECGDPVGPMDKSCANCGAELPAAPGVPGAPAAPAAPGMPGAPAPAAPKM